MPGSLQRSCDEFHVIAFSQPMPRKIRQAPLGVRTIFGRFRYRTLNDIVSHCSSGHMQSRSVVSVAVWLCIQSPQQAETRILACLKTMAI